MKEKTRNTLRRFLSLLLAVAISITGQAMPVVAETAEKDVGHSSNAAENAPVNPVHHCGSSSDVTDWSYVYFGNYPQTEITGDALTLAIVEADYDENGDAWVNDVRYRRINNPYYDEDDSEDAEHVQYRYFKWERIKWRVLENAGSTLFLMADKGLDYKKYHDDGDSVTWEDCTLRSWLNSEFYNTAFSGSEQGAIVEQNVVNENNPDYNTEGGNDTKDNIYLLSIRETANPEYGFCGKDDIYSYSSGSRGIQVSDYTRAWDEDIDTGDGRFEGNGSWWLRSPGDDTDCAAYVDDNGGVCRDGNYVDTTYEVCVPALHINLSSDLWYLADEGWAYDFKIGIGEFSLESSGTVGNSMTIRGRLLLSEQAEDSAELLQKEIDKITWTSSDPSIIDPATIQCFGFKTDDYRLGYLHITAVPQKRGTVTVKGKASNDKIAVCEVTVGMPPNNPKHNCTNVIFEGLDLTHCEDLDTADWNYVYFGSYPQTEVTGDALTAAIIRASYDGKGDAWVDGIKYRRISKNNTNNTSYFGDTQYRYFKWERIKWRVLQNDGNTLFLVADKGLDCKAYNETETLVNWEECTLRRWLNGEFYGTAFSGSEQSAMVEQDVANKNNPDYTEGLDSASDKIFLLSGDEALNPKYGFCGAGFYLSVSRRIQASDYAHVKGAGIGSNGACFWWLRGSQTVGAFGNCSQYVSSQSVINRATACVPALYINLSSDFWFLTDDGTSGEGGNGGFEHEHTWNAGEETTKPTCTNRGTKTYACTTCGETKTEEIPAAGHQHTEIRNQKNSTCAKAGYTGDKYCKDCQKVIETGKALDKAAHQYETAVTAKATPSEDGSMVKKCAVCGETSGNTVIARIQSVTLSKTKYVYNKKARKPAVTVKDSKGNTIDPQFYTVAYKDNQKVGKASLTVQLKGNYEGAVTKTFQIVPKATKITKVTAAAKGFKVTWKKQKESTTGYQLQYSTSKKFTKKTTKAKTVKKASAAKLTVKKLKAEKKYYVRIRTYKTVKGKKYYSSWSKAKSVKTGR